MRFFNQVCVEGFYRSRAFSNAAYFIAAAGINGGTLYLAYKKANENHQWYLSLPPEEQRKIYNNCPEQRLGTTYDAMSALHSFSMMNDPALKKIPPKVSYEESVERRFKNKMPLTEHVKNKNNYDYFNVLIAGSVSGFAGPFITFPFASAKKRLQSGQPLPSISKLGPQQWVRENFRGSFGCAGLLMPTAVIQQLSDQYWKQRAVDLSSGQFFGTLFSGAIGGVAATVSENILLQQQMEKMTALQSSMSLMKQSPTRIFRGMQMTMMREMIFGYCYLKGLVQAGDYAKAHFGEQYRTPAQMMVGILGALTSHPFDTTATTMQRYGYTKTRQAVQHLWNQPSAIKAFYKGGLMRMGLFTAGIVVVSNTQQAVMNRL